MGKSIKKPSKINFVSLLFFFGIAAVIYSLIQFGPAYYRKWQVKEALSEAKSKLAKYSRPGSSASVEALSHIEKETEDAIRGIGVKDPGLKVKIIRTADQIFVTADYKEVIKHPLIGKTTAVRFRPFQKMSIKGGD